jgi:hypothetical protein
LDPRLSHLPAKLSSLLARLAHPLNPSQRARHLTLLFLQHVPPVLPSLLLKVITSLVIGALHVDVLIDDEKAPKPFAQSERRLPIHLFLQELADNLVDLLRERGLKPSTESTPPTGNNVRRVLLGRTQEGKRVGCIHDGTKDGKCARCPEAAQQVPILYVFQTGGSGRPCRSGILELDVAPIRKIEAIRGHQDTILADGLGCRVGRHYLRSAWN